MADSIAQLLSLAEPRCAFDALNRAQLPGSPSPLSWEASL